MYNLIKQHYFSLISFLQCPPPRVVGRRPRVSRVWPATKTDWEPLVKCIGTVMVFMGSARGERLFF